LRGGPRGEYVDARRRGKHVRRKDVDLEKVWDVESATGNGVLYVGHSKNETSKRRIPLNGPARDAITRMLIGQGEKDGRLISSDAVFVGLQRLGKKVEYRIYENEGHVISRKANVLDFWKRRIEFLDEYLDITRDDRGRLILQDGRAKGRPRTAGN
jgi:prolyl oligopeptidase family protein